MDDKLFSQMFADFVYRREYGPNYAAVLREHASSRPTPLALAAHIPQALPAFTVEPTEVPSAGASPRIRAPATSPGEPADSRNILQQISESPLQQEPRAVQAAFQVASQAAPRPVFPPNPRPEVQPAPSPIAQPVEQLPPQLAALPGVQPIAQSTVQQVPRPMLHRLPPPTAFDSTPSEAASRAVRVPSQGSTIPLVQETGEFRTPAPVRYPSSYQYPQSEPETIPAIQPTREGALSTLAPFRYYAAPGAYQFPEVQFTAPQERYTHSMGAAEPLVGQKRMAPYWQESQEEEEVSPLQGRKRRSFIRRGDRSDSRSGSAPESGDDDSGKRFPCPACDSVFRQNGQLARHYRRVHEKVWKLYS